MFVSTENHGEEFLRFDLEYHFRSKFYKSFLKTIDFAFAKDSYRFTSLVGTIYYVFGLYYLNIIMLNLVIALVGDQYEESMQVKKESELKLKARMLLDLYYFQSTFMKESDVEGNIFVFREVEEAESNDEW